MSCLCCRCALLSKTPVNSIMRTAVKKNTCLSVEAEMPPHTGEEPRENAHDCAEHDQLRGVEVQVPLLRENMAGTAVAPRANHPPSSPLATHFPVKPRSAP